MTFENLSLTDSILKALKKTGYTKPTPIQSEAIPIILQGNDLLGCAQTGTGKTAAFSIPIIQNIDNAFIRDGRKPGIKALILTPTRELAIQIGDCFTAYGQYTQVRHTVIFGGVGQKPQTDSLAKGIDVLIATPGRLLDLIGQGFIKLNNIEYFVLDEADRMLDMGFIHDIKKIIPMLPKKRQSLFFSATMPAEIEKLAATILYKPQKVEVAPQSSTVDAIEQRLYYVDRTKKIELLIELLSSEEMKSVLIFTRTKHGADRVARALNKAKIQADAIHGDKSQNARQRALNNFKEHKSRVLIATDIAARGIDVDNISHVVNFELPNEAETYVHRIGRTGRAGKDGIAISFCSAEEVPDLNDIEKLIGKRINVVYGEKFNKEDILTATKERKEAKEKSMQEFRRMRAEGTGKFAGQGRKDKPGRQNKAKRSQDKKIDDHSFSKPEKQENKGNKSSKQLHKRPNNYRTSRRSETKEKSSNFSDNTDKKQVDDSKKKGFWSRFF